MLLIATLMLSFTLQAQESAVESPVLDHVRMETTLGTIIIRLNAEKAPVSVENFTRYVNEGFYEGTVFHRVIDGFMIQGGGFDEKMSKKTTHEPIKNEASNGLSNLRGTIAMARTVVRDSATSQFYINVKDNPALDYQGEMNSRTWGYAVFGAVVSGMDVVDAIRVVPTGPSGAMHSNVPLTPVVINKVEMIAAPEASTDPEAREADSPTSESEQGTTTP